jgi:hypothetical protein|tara:strand:+ start:361 stop:612 length:252 start_codon:yes stop_codon:yes gene_type:complete
MQAYLKEFHRLFSAGSAFLLWLVSTERTYSCAVCFSANDESRGAYLFTTGLLSAMPLLIIASVVFWFKHRCGQLNAVRAEPKK